MSLRKFCTRFTKSRAIPSRLRSSVMVMSNATVTPPSAATAQPGISSELINTSSTTRSNPSFDSFPAFSMMEISSLLIPLMTADTSFIFAPYCFPSLAKFGFTFLTNKPEASSMYSIDFTFTSALMMASTLRTRFANFSSNTGNNIF